MMKAIFFDLDDTLTQSKQVVDSEMIIPFTKLLENKIVVIVSGAGFEQQLNQFISHLPESARFENLYSFPENAAECVKWNNEKWETQYSFKLKDEEVEEIMNAFLFALNETHFVDDEPSYGERIENRGAQITFSALGQLAPLDLKHKWDPDQKKRKQIVELLYIKIPDYEIKIGGGTSIDITHKGINKTYAINWLSKNLSIPINEMTYIGDSLFLGGNDSVVKETGITTIETKGPKQTIEIINTIL